MSSESQARRPSPLGEHALRQLIRAALDRGYFTESLHAEAEHPERGISIDDVLFGLEREDWTLAKPPNYDERHRSWEYLIRTVDIEEDELHVKLAAYPAEKRIEIITRW
jgi:hypothetical protein